MMLKNLFLAIYAGCLVAGCGGSGEEEAPPLAEVSGMVTLNGKPLPKATVMFFPVKEGRVSTGVTDDNGAYSLSYEPSVPGAVKGFHRVEIRTGGETLDADGQLVEEVPEILPENYHSQTRLAAEVGEPPNQINFELVKK
tara:strand:+ start:46561 stop:46980 length:420 start_codon:yes stop_codon:yes gene_type:complete